MRPARLGVGNADQLALGVKTAVRVGGQQRADGQRDGLGQIGADGGQDLLATLDVFEPHDLAYQHPRRPRSRAVSAWLKSVSARCLTSPKFPEGRIFDRHDGKLQIDLVELFLVSRRRGPSRHEGVARQTADGLAGQVNGSAGRGPPQAVAIVIRVNIAAGDPAELARRRRNFVPGR